MLTIENAGPEHQALVERLSALFDLEKTTMQEMREEASRRGWAHILEDVMRDLGMGGPAGVTCEALIEYEQQVSEHNLHGLHTRGLRSGTAQFARRVSIRVPTDQTTCQCANVTERMARLALWNAGIIADGPIEIKDRRCRAQGGHILS